MTYIQNPLSYEAPATAKTISKRQEEIITKASKLLSKKGSDGLTIKNLAKEMKFSEAALYRHFGSKEKIIVAMLENLILQLDEMFNEMDKEMPVPHRFNSYFDRLFEFFSINRQLTDVAFMDGLYEKTQDTKEAFEGITRILQKHLIPIVMDGKLSGDFPMALNADRIVHILLGTFRLQMQKWSANDYQFDIQQTGKGIMTSLFPLFRK